MKNTNNHLLNKLLNNNDGPCISLYQSTSKCFPQTKKDSIAFKNLLKTIEKLIDDSEMRDSADLILTKFRDLIENQEFWANRTEGLAIFANPELFEVINLQISVKDEVFISDIFHLTPLINHFQSIDRFQILALSLHEAKLYEASKLGIQIIEPIGFPNTIKEALGSELTEPHETVASYGGVGSGADAMHHGHGSKSEEAEKDRDRFFRFIDKKVVEYFSQPSNLPLILAALPEHQSHFHEISKNNLLMEEGILKDPMLMKSVELEKEAWKIIEPKYQQRLADLAAKYNKLSASNLASNDPEEVIEAAKSGRIETLLLEANQKISSNELHKVRSKEDTTRNIVADNNSKSQDITDYLAKMVFKTNGEVIILPRENMPSDSGLAALYRF